MAQKSMIKIFDLHMTLNYEKKQDILDLFVRHLGRENQNSKMIALAYHYSNSYL